MNSRLWIRLTSSLLVALCVSLFAEDRQEKDRDGKKKSAEAADQGAKGKDKGADEAEGKAKKPAANPEDVNNFRKRKDAAAVEIVTLHDEIDKAYTELRTALNVASGDDKHARKAKTEAKALESKIKRQLRKLEGDVDKFAQPIERDYKATKSKYDQLQDKAKQLEEQNQEKKAVTYYQQADRYTGKMEGARRMLDTVRSFLYFESAEGLGLDDDDDDARGNRSRSRRP